jgi:hypothetical protein
MQKFLIAPIIFRFEALVLRKGGHVMYACIGYLESTEL